MQSLIGGMGMGKKNVLGEKNMNYLALKAGFPISAENKFHGVLESIHGGNMERIKTVL